MAHFFLRRLGYTVPDYAVPFYTVLHLSSLHLFSFHLLHAMSDPRDSGFDLNVRLEEDDNGNFAFNLNEPILEDYNDSGNVFPSLSLLFPSSSTFSEFVVSFLTGFDLNLTLDEYGAVDFDYVQNLPGNFF